MALEGDTTELWCDSANLGRTGSLEDLEDLRQLQATTLTVVGVVGFFIIGFLLMCMLYKNERLLEKMPCRKKDKASSDETMCVENAIMTLVTAIPAIPSIRVTQVAPQEPPTSQTVTHFPSHKTMLVDIAPDMSHTMNLFPEAGRTPPPSPVSILKTVRSGSIIFPTKAYVHPMMGGATLMSCIHTPTVGERPIYMSTVSLGSTVNMPSCSTSCSDMTDLSTSTAPPAAAWWQEVDEDTVAESHRGARGEKGHGLHSKNAESDNYGNTMGATRKGI